MPHESMIDELLRCLINGDRAGSRRILSAAVAGKLCPRDIVCDILWPVYEQIDALHRQDHITELGHNLATRLLRLLADQAAGSYEMFPKNGRRIFAFCGPTEADELAAEMAVSLLEAEGFDVRFAGGGVARDEILGAVQETRPDVLLLFASAPRDLPDIRALIDTLDEIGACKQTQIVVGGGVFNRADGLAEEIGADLWATDPLDLLAAMVDGEDIRAATNQRTVGKRQRTRAA